MATNPHPEGAAAPSPEPRDELLVKVETWDRRLGHMSRWTRFVTALSVLFIVSAVVVAFAPALLQVVAYDQNAPSKIAFTDRWRNIFLGVALVTAFLLAMYLHVSDRAQRLAKQIDALDAGAASHGLAAASSIKDAFAVYSPPGFVEDLNTHLEHGLAGWGQRALYVGVEGARSWLAVSQHPAYDIAEAQLGPALESVLAGVERLGSLISLGPGDGKVDISLMSRLVATRGHGISYVPIDISEGLLLVTMKRFRKEHADVRMSFGILGDFEYGWDHFRHLLAGEQHPRLFSILGNTVSNVDAGLEKFFPKFWGGVAVGDYVLFDVLLGDFDEVLGSDQSSSFDPNLLFPEKEEVMRRYKEFIGYGARRISMDHRVFDEEERKLTKRLVVHRRKDAPGGYDQLHLEYRGDRDEKRTIFKWRRYQPGTEHLENWLRHSLQGCQVIGKSDVTDDGKTTRLILLRRDGGKA